MKDKSIYQNAQNRKLEKNTHDLNIGVGYGNSAFCSFPFACCLLSPVEMRTGAVHLRFIRSSLLGVMRQVRHKGVCMSIGLPSDAFQHAEQIGIYSRLQPVRYGGTQLTSEC